METQMCNLGGEGESAERTFEERLAFVRRRIDEACQRVGRRSAEVSLLAVTKKVEPERISEAAGCGLTVFGESRVQEAKQKIPLCPGHLEWHMIGHLQTNKVRDAVQLFGMIHAVDSMRLLEAIDSAREAVGTPIRACIEVNLSGEGSKFGLRESDVLNVLKAAVKMERVEIAGLLTIPPFTEDPGAARPIFRALRELRDRLAAETGMKLPELSMGMSHDFEVAIEEGATWVRVGSALFGERGGGRDG